MKKGLYKHYKGGEYQVLENCIHSETLEELVFYKALKNNTFWVRPKKMFIEKILIDGKSVDRFLFISA